MTLEYDGTPFSGWQRQADSPSVQQSLEEVLRIFEPECPAIQAAGRTDAGVHATGQVVHCDLRARPWDPLRLQGALNAHLRPLPIAVKHVTPVNENFSARFSALERTYMYRILNRSAPSVLDANRVWHIRHSLDVDSMRMAARILTGKHDFTTFRAARCQARSPVKTVDAITIHTLHKDGIVDGQSEIYIIVRARSFLHTQVRSLVGTLERVGTGAWSLHRVRAALEARCRKACGPLAPAKGLYLAHVRYEQAHHE